jgi:Ni/Fe-hydrogenase subunit HybB-like protein
LLDVFLINIFAYLNDFRFVIFANFTSEILFSAVFSLSKFLSLLFFDLQFSVMISFKMLMSIIFLITKKNSRDFKIVFLNHFFSCWLHFQFDDLINLTMCSQFFQLCMFSHKYCRFALLSFSVEIENVDFCDWDWDCD